MGKTALAVHLAEELHTEIVSCDSRQLYKELSVGTAVPSEEELKRVKHHLIQTISVHDYYNASMFEFEVINILENLYKKYPYVVMAGGSGLYIDAVIHGIDDLPTIDQNIRKDLKKQFHKFGIEHLQELLKKADPRYYEKVDLNNPKRLLKALEIHQMTGKPYSEFLTKPKKTRHFIPVLIGLNLDREELYNRINKRVDQMVEKGLLEEARKFYPERELNSLNTVGYKELFQCFDGKMTLEESIEKIKANTRKYARKQLTWFRRYKDVKWFNPDEKEEILKYIKEKQNDHGKQY